MNKAELLLLAVALILVTLVLWEAVAVARDRRARSHRRSRHRSIARDWWIQNWLFGHRKVKRLTYRRSDQDL